MSIKKLFNKGRQGSRNYADYADEKTTFEDVESLSNAQQIAIEKSTYVPQVDYSDPQNFVKFGSADLYYSGALNRIADYYPYDGSEAEKNKFYNNLFDAEKYIFDNLYPRFNGYAILGASGVSYEPTKSADGYGRPSSGYEEYIAFTGGPNSGSGGTLKQMAPNPYNNKYQGSNIYDESIYTTAGLPTDYGVGTRESNLKSNFDTGVTVEFWLKKNSFDTSATEKEVILDIWNNELSSSDSYGRITIELDGTTGASPFLVTVQSGTVSASVFANSIGENITTSTLENWTHYAFRFYNSNNTFVSKLYTNGTLNDTNLHTDCAMGEITTKAMLGRIGALVTSPSASAAIAGDGTLSASIDDFRFWKSDRDSRKISLNYFVNVGGGANTDISNANLGVYYKFNEGITENSTIDSVVLDYAGRVTNGLWTGYDSYSRNTGSAIVLAGAANTEYKEPVVRKENTSFVNLKADLGATGAAHDANNNTAFMNYMPAWVLDEHETTENTNLKIISHIAGMYFDKMYLMAADLPKFKQLNYTTASSEPIPFASHLPTSMGLYVPELFVDASILERMLDRTEKELYENKLNEIKNLIYLNLYNNLTNIYKAKGTEKAIRNVFRCFNIDDNLLRLSTYNKNATYELKTNLKQQAVEKNTINFNTAGSNAAVVYQAKNTSNAESSGYISGSQGDGSTGPEEYHGATTEVDILFPRFFLGKDKFDRNFTEVSLFGIHTVDTGSNNSLDGTDTTLLASDPGNFQVFAVRDEKYSSNVYFKLTSSVSPNPLPELSSSTFFDVYDENQWNISVRVKPKNYPNAGMVSGSLGNEYDVIFRGTNSQLGTILNSFEVTGTVSNQVGAAFLRAPKRLYVGARRTNLTGAVLQKNDTQILNARHWAKYIDNHSLDIHSHGDQNSGVSDSQLNVSPIDRHLSTPADLTNKNTLTLNWTFNNVTASDATGNFTVQDYSSGSVMLRENYGWLGKIAGYQHSGYGYGFQASSTDVRSMERINVFNFIDPEQVVASNMINILSDDDEVLEIDETVPNYIFTVEKSMYQSVSTEMINFFAGAVDFNNIIGDPVNRYRDRYKAMEKLRQAFYDRVTTVSDVEKYMEYYKWFDDALSTIISQLVPASADFTNDVMNMVESHVLERNKYQTKFPTLEAKTPEPEAPAYGITEKVYNWRLAHSPPPRSPRDTTVSTEYWKKRAERTHPDISSGDSTIDEHRETYRRIINTNPFLSRSISNLFDADAAQNYGIDTYQRRNFIKDFSEKVDKTKVIKAGVNFDSNKNIHFVYSSLYPAGPINSEGGRIVPLNVLLSFMEDLVKVQTDNDPKLVTEKVKRYTKVLSGRDYEEGVGYKNMKSSMAFPFNILHNSGANAVRTGYQKQIEDRLPNTNITITNLHNDVYGPDMEVPMQGPFTNYAVGGHQSRHIRINEGGDNWLNRAEAWKIHLGTCATLPESGTGEDLRYPSGAIGMTGPDYPNQADYLTPNPYPEKRVKKAVYYRDHIAKRPVNIRNIKLTTGSTILGNYRETYQYVQATNASSNPRQFIENPPTLPDRVFINNTTSSMFVRTFLDMHRTSSGHVTNVSEYDVGYLNGTTNKSVFISRFSHGGGIEVSTRGYQDFRSSEFSVYNGLNNRNLTVLKPWQGPAASISEPDVSGDTTNIKVSDIHKLDYGLKSHLSRHTARFGRDSLIYPPDDRRKPYDLTKSLIGYSGPKVYRSSDALQGWWRMNKIASTGDVTDSSGNGRPGTFDANNERPTYEDILGPSRYISSGSLQFVNDATPDAMNIGTAATWDAIIGNDTSNGSTQKMTFAAWVYKTGSGGSGYGRIIDFGASDIILYSNTSGSLVFESNWSTTNGQFVTPTDTLSTGAWHHVIVTYDATSVNNEASIYVDGAAKAITVAAAPAGTYSGINTNDCYVGNRFNKTRGFEGNLADVAVWNSILTEEEVQALYNASKLPENFGPGTATTELPGFHKVHRNNLKRKMKRGSAADWNTCDEYVCDDNQYDNYFVQHSIPRSTKQYSWITASLESDRGWIGYLPSDFYVKKSKLGLDITMGDEFVPAYSFCSASEYGAYMRYAGSRRYFGSTRDELAADSARGDFIPVDFARLNTVVYEPMSASSNTLGYPSSFGVATSSVSSDYGTFKPYLNPTMIWGLADNTPPHVGTPAVLNSLLLNRNGPYGWTSWKALRQADHPILRNERKTSVFSVTTTPPGAEEPTIETFSLPPVSNRGKPNMVNFFMRPRMRKSKPYTFAVTDENERIYFNQVTADNKFAPKLTNFVTPGHQMLMYANTMGNSINWVVYSQQLFPSIRNEFTPTSTNKVGYDNLFWRDDRTQRNAVNAHFGRASTPTNTYSALNAFGIYVSQSCWALDAPQDFLTRGNMPLVPVLSSSYRVETGLTFESGSPGQLQNAYMGFASGSAVLAAGHTPSEQVKMAYRIKALGPIYARKHVFQARNSVRSPYGPALPHEKLSGSMAANTLLEVLDISDPQGPPDPADVGSGEALWETGPMAGIVTRSAETSDRWPNGIPEFVPAPSEPWYNSYGDYRHDIKLKAKGYSVIPEFRISEHVNRYLEGDTFAFSDIGLEVPHLEGANSKSDDDFYITYTNSEFLKDFLRIRKTAALQAKEIRLSVTGAIRFNPYKGFYPAQRTIQLVEQFNRSYGDAIMVHNTNQDPPMILPGSGSGELGANPRQHYLLDPRNSTSTSVVSNTTVNVSYAAAPLIQALYGPGLLYNTIKSGLAVDYPIVLDGSKIMRYSIDGGPYADLAAQHTSSNGTGSWVLDMTSDATRLGHANLQESRWEMFDFRVPFETLIEPEKHIAGKPFIDMEPNPRMRSDFTASLLKSVDNTDGYKAMANNFFGAIPSFFLKNEEFTNIKSNLFTDTYRFKGNETFMMRVTLNRSTSGSRTYQYEYDGFCNPFDGDESAYALYGGRPVLPIINTGTGWPAYYSNDMQSTASSYQKFESGQYYELPQDPALNPFFKETFTMYSRPTAFGPEITGRDGLETGSFTNLSAKDCFSGFNPAYTPPYYNGEAWCDMIFRPSASHDYTLRDIMSEIQSVYWRFDPGSMQTGSTSGTPTMNRTLIQATGTLSTIQSPAWDPTAPASDVWGTHPYGGHMINNSSMQLGASFNLFGYETEEFVEKDKFGNTISTRPGTTVGERWVIRSKFETPMLNFADSGIQPVISGSSKTYPMHFGSSSAPSGMWHQFGTIPEPSKGVHIRVDDISENWLKNHYLVNYEPSIYNNYKQTDVDYYKQVLSLADLVGFKTGNKRKIGRLKDKQVLREAVVAIPYIIEEIERVADIPNAPKYRKYFIEIPEQRYRAAQEEMIGSLVGDSTFAAGSSVSKQLQKMKRYIFPPQLDFVNNPQSAPSPYVMYIFEFEYELDRDDLSYIWQNLAPRDYKKLSFQKQSVAHELIDAELLNEKTLLDNQHLRWMVFKVKQKGQEQYFDYTDRQIANNSNNPLQFLFTDIKYVFDDIQAPPEYKVKHNWPYDYVSFVEMVKVNSEILYAGDLGPSDPLGMGRSDDAPPNSPSGPGGDGPKFYSPPPPDPGDFNGGDDPYDFGAPWSQDDAENNSIKEAMKDVMTDDAFVRKYGETKDGEEVPKDFGGAGKAGGGGDDGGGDDGDGGKRERDDGGGKQGPKVTFWGGINLPGGGTLGGGTWGGGGKGGGAWFGGGGTGGAGYGGGFGVTVHQSTAADDGGGGSSGSGTSGVRNLVRNIDPRMVHTPRYRTSSQQSSASSMSVRMTRTTTLNRTSGPSSTARNTKKY